MAWWDVCNQGTTCLPWNPSGGAFGVHGARNDYGIPLPYGTPITAPVSGIVLPQHPGGAWYSVFGQQSFGGEVDMLTWLPEYGGLVNVGVIHMDTARVRPGDIVTKGQTILGASGGQTSGGNWPSSPQYSTGPHVGLTVHSPFSWSNMMNPETLMRNLWAGKDSSQVPSHTQLQSAGLGGIPLGQLVGNAGNASSSGNGCTGINWWCLLAPPFVNCDIGCPPDNPAFQGNQNQPTTAWYGQVRLWVSQPIRILKLIAGAALLGIGLIIALLPDLGAAAVTAAGVPEAAPFVRHTLSGSRGPGGAARSGLHTFAAIRGQKTLIRRQAAGFAQAQQVQHQKNVAAAKKGVQTRRANKAKAQQAQQAQQPPAQTHISLPHGPGGTPPPNPPKRSTRLKPSPPGTAATTPVPGGGQQTMRTMAGPNVPGTGRRLRTPKRGPGTGPAAKPPGNVQRGSMSGEDFRKAQQRKPKPGQTWSDFLNS